MRLLDRPPVSPHLPGSASVDGGWHRHPDPGVAGRSSTILPLLVSAMRLVAVIAAATVCEGRGYPLRPSVPVETHVRPADVGEAAQSVAWCGVAEGEWMAVGDRFRRRFRFVELGADASAIPSVPRLGVSIEVRRELVHVSNQVFEVEVSAAWANSPSWSRSNPIMWYGRAACVTGSVTLTPYFESIELDVH